MVSWSGWWWHEFIPMPEFIDTKFTFTKIYAFYCMYIYFFKWKSSVVLLFHFPFLSFMTFLRSIYQLFCGMTIHLSSFSWSLMISLCFGFFLFLLFFGGNTTEVMLSLLSGKRHQFDPLLVITLVTGLRWCPPGVSTVNYFSFCS